MYYWWHNIGAWPVVLTAIIAIVIWALLMITIYRMIRARAHTVLIVFACLSLGPLPPQFVTAVLWIIFWAIFGGRLSTSRR
jgi:hypothetical protein